MSDYMIPDPEPKEIDEKLSIELRHLARTRCSRARHTATRSASNCLYYLEPTRRSPTAGIRSCASS